MSIQKQKINQLFLRLKNSFFVSLIKDNYTYKSLKNAKKLAKSIKKYRQIAKSRIIYIKLQIAVTRYKK